MCPHDLQYSLILSLPAIPANKPTPPKSTPPTAAFVLLKPSDMVITSKFSDLHLGQAILAPDCSSFGLSGSPQLGHEGALSLISLPHSGQLIKAILFIVLGLYMSRRQYTKVIKFA